MAQFYENPLHEQQLSFSFPEPRGATRYELWDSHVARIGKKAVDFIYPVKAEMMLYFTEIKDFMTITRKGKFGEGDYSQALADNIAQKVVDSFSGYGAVNASSPIEEQIFAQETAGYNRSVVFHWEFNSATGPTARKRSMMLMKQKLRQLLYATCTQIRIENTEYNPSPVWNVTRLN